jgi:hypothetical protein
MKVGLTVLLRSRLSHGIMGRTCTHGSYQILNGEVIREESRSLSKTTKLLLLDSLLQEVCIESDSDGSLTKSLLGVECPSCQSQPSLFRAKESPLKNHN